MRRYNPPTSLCGCAPILSSGKRGEQLSAKRDTTSEPSPLYSPKCLEGNSTKFASEGSVYSNDVGAYTSASLHRSQEEEAAMPQTISPGFRKLMREPAYCQLATLMPDGSPQNTQMWVETDGEHILVNT